MRRRSRRTAPVNERRIRCLRRAGKTAQEVARELSMQPGTVRVAKSRVLHRLRKELGELPE
jgi:DNA-binding CsgD family transcriptional regulator